MDDGSTDTSARSGVLYLVISGAPAPEGIPELVKRCQDAGWRVVVFSTPLGVRFTDPGKLEELTGEPVRSDYRMPGTAKGLPSAGAVLACPLTFNSVNKFAHGHADNFAIGLLCELLGYGVPVTVVPHCKPQLASHPAFGASLATLRSAGVNVLFDPAAPYERRLPSWRDVVATLPAQDGRIGPCPGGHLGAVVGHLQGGDPVGGEVVFAARLLPESTQEAEQASWMTC